MYNRHRPVFRSQFVRSIAVGRTSWRVGWLGRVYIGGADGATRIRQVTADTKQRRLLAATSDCRKSAHQHISRQEQHVVGRQVGQQVHGDAAAVPQTVPGGSGEPRCDPARSVDGGTAETYRRPHQTSTSRSGHPDGRLRRVVETVLLGRHGSDDPDRRQLLLRRQAAQRRRDRMATVVLVEGERASVDAGRRQRLPQAGAPCAEGDEEPRAGPRAAHVLPPQDGALQNDGRVGRRRPVEGGAPRREVDGRPRADREGTRRRSHAELLSTRC